MYVCIPSLQEVFSEDPTFQHSWFTSDAYEFIPCLQPISIYSLRKCCWLFAECCPPLPYHQRDETEPTGRSKSPANPKSEIKHGISLSDTHTHITHHTDTYTNTQSCMQPHNQTSTHAHTCESIESSYRQNGWSVDDEHFQQCEPDGSICQPSQKHRHLQWMRHVT